jgi:hypothetical protein
MRVFASMLSLSLLAAPAVAQQAVDPSGRWEGVVTIPERDLRVLIDLGRDAKGNLIGTFGELDSGVKGFPISEIRVKERKLELLVKAGAQPSTFAGEISADGKSFAGDASQAGATAPFRLTRTGNPQFAAAPKNAAVSKELEGTWHGALELGERKMRLVLKLANQPDGGASGTIMSPDGSGMEIAVGLKQQDASLHLLADSVGASYTGTLNAASGELSGTWSQGGATLPLTFRRAEK